MKYNNDELIGIGEDVLASINLALSEVDRVEEYSEVYDLLEEAKEAAEEVRDKYSSIEYEKEQRELNAEYLASVWCE